MKEYRCTNLHMSLYLHMYVETFAKNEIIYGDTRTIKRIDIARLVQREENFE